MMSVAKMLEITYSEIGKKITDNRFYDELEWHCVGTMPGGAWIGEETHFFRDGSSITMTDNTIQTSVWYPTKISLAKLNSDTLRDYSIIYINYKGRLFLVRGRVDEQTANETWRVTDIATNTMCKPAHAHCASCIKIKDIKSAITTFSKELLTEER